jgi:hypothetical protein
VLAAACGIYHHSASLSQRRVASPSARLPRRTTTHHHHQQRRLGSHASSPTSSSSSSSVSACLPACLRYPPSSPDAPDAVPSRGCLDRPARHLAHRQPPRLRLKVRVHPGARVPPEGPHVAAPLRRRAVGLRRRQPPEGLLGTGTAPAAAQLPDVCFQHGEGLLLRARDGLPPPQRVAARGCRGGGSHTRAAVLDLPCTHARNGNGNGNGTGEGGRRGGS